RHVRTMVVAGVGVTALIGFAPVLIPNEVFSRDIPPVWWDYPVWILTGVLSGALIATYVSEPGAQAGQKPASEAHWKQAAEAGQDRRAEAGRGPGTEPSERSSSRTSADPGAEFSTDAAGPGEQIGRAHV